LFRWCSSAPKLKCLGGVPSATQLTCLGGVPSATQLTCSGGVPSATQLTCSDGVPSATQLQFAVRSWSRAVWTNLQIKNLLCSTNSRKLNFNQRCFKNTRNSSPTHKHVYTALFQVLGHVLQFHLQWINFSSP
jgi:hypothetical protein